MFQPEINPEHAISAADFLRSRMDAELSQAIASPRALVDRLPGFTIHHLRTAAEFTVVQLAKDEQLRRRDAQANRRSRNAFLVSIGSLCVASLALARAVI